VPEAGRALLDKWTSAKVAYDAKKSLALPDFRITDHGSVLNIRALSPEAIAFTRDNFEVEAWQGIAENFTTDHRAARDLAARLIAEGWDVA
jgi:hypothetical protein